MSLPEAFLVQSGGVASLVYAGQHEEAGLSNAKAMAPSNVD